MTDRFIIDPQNRLVVSVTRPDRGTRPEKVVLDGKWELTPQHDLKFHVIGKETPETGKTLILKGDIEKAGGNSLTFRVRQCDTASGIRTHTIQLKGKWRADGNNRITFDVAKARARYDSLTFQGKWTVNKRNELVYRYSKTHLKKKTRTERTIAFKGYWEFGKTRLVYRLERSSDSFFSFKVSIQSRSLMAKEGAIRYQVGIRYEKGKVYRTIRETVTIYGTWKLGRDLKVGFEVMYSGGRHRRSKFLVEHFTGKDTSVTLSLIDEKGEPLGFEVTFTKAFEDDAELFLSLSRFARESRITGGVRIRF